jgi:hypothetical protein
VPVADFSVSRTFFTFTFLSQLNEEENREDIAASPEGSTSNEGSSDSGEGGSGGSSSSSNRAAAAVATAVMETVTAGKPPNKRMVPRRWMLQTRRHIRTLGVFKIACTFM